MGLGLPALGRRRLRNDGLLVALLVGAVAGLGVAAALVLRLPSHSNQPVKPVAVVDTRNSSTPTLTNVNEAELSLAYITLLPPDAADKPKVSSNQAAAFALKEFPFAGAEVRQVLLARVDYSGAPGSGHEFCWVVDLTPRTGRIVLGGGTPGSPVPTAKWFLVFVNAVTGDLVFARAD